MCSLESMIASFGLYRSKFVRRQSHHLSIPTSTVPMRPYESNCYWVGFVKERLMVNMTSCCNDTGRIVAMYRRSRLVHVTQGAQTDASF